jgi:AcrR family transcriptional regulator
MPYRVTERGERRRQEMRLRILDAAQHLFVERGYGATSLREVVEAAGTSIGNCYFYFASKEVLLRAVVERASEELGPVIDRAMASVPPPARAGVAVYTGLTWILERPGLARLVLLDVPRAGPRELAVGHFTERARRFMAEAPEVLRGRQPELVAQAWMGAIFHVMEAAVTGLVQASPRAVARFTAEWNLAALRLPPPAMEAAMAGLDAFISAQEDSERDRQHP